MAEVGRASTSLLHLLEAGSTWGVQGVRTRSTLEQANGGGGVRVSIL